jgi:predicted amidohydrolase YtcJ
LVYVGDDYNEAKSLLGRSFEALDLKGLTIVPGLIDSHAHVTHEGLRLGQLDLSGLSYVESLRAVGQAVKNLPPGAFLHGRGWDQNIWEGRPWPNRKDLDEVSPEHPVVLDRVDKHSIWVNTKALDLAGPSVWGPDPVAGEILKDSCGEPLGVLIGQAMFLVYEALPPLDGRDRRATIYLAEKEFLSYGLTTVVDAAFGEEDFKVVEAAYAQGEMRIRYRGYAHPGHWPHLAALKRVDGLFQDHLAVDGLKLFSDGSLGSRSAWLFNDYHDRPGHKGASSLTNEALAQWLTLARDKDLQVAIHVIGDAAVAQAVDMIARVLGPGWSGRRWRLEHFQVVAPRDMDRVLTMGLIPSIQSVGLMTDLLMAEDRLGPDGLARAYAWRDILDRGGYLINGSDCPVEPVNPFFGIYAAVTRRNLAGLPKEGFTPAHRLTIWEALASYTVWAARAAFQEGKLGVLKPGALADFVALDQDLFAIKAAAIPKTKAILTVVGGETAYSRL